MPATTHYSSLTPSARSWLQSRIDRAQRTRSEFIAKLNQPMEENCRLISSTLQWDGMGAMQAEKECELYDKAVYCSNRGTDPVSFERSIELLTEQLDCWTPGSSTNAMANLINEVELRAARNVRESLRITLEVTQV